MVELRVQDLPTLRDAAWCLWVNTTGEPCHGCGMILPFLTAAAPPHGVGGAQHRPFVTIKSGTPGRVEVPLTAIALDPDLVVALSDAVLRALRDGLVLPQTDDVVVESAITRARVLGAGLALPQQLRA